MRRALIFRLATFGALAFASARVDAPNPTLRGVSPRKVGTSGGALLVIQGMNFPFSVTGKAPRNDLILVGDEPCTVVKERSAPRGRSITCTLPLMENPGHYAVTVAGVGCENCFVEYSNDLTPSAWVTAPGSSGSSAPSFVAGGHVPVVLALPPNHRVSSTEQFRATIGGVNVPVPTSAFGDDLGSDSSFIAHLLSNQVADGDYRPLMVSLPLPPNMPAGAHALELILDRAGPEEDEAHGQVLFIKSDGSGIHGLALDITVVPTVTGTSHSRVGECGGVTVILDGGGFSAVRDENRVTLGGRPCNVFSSSFHRLRCTLADAATGNATADAGLAAVDQLHRGLALHLWHLGHATDGNDAMEQVTWCLTAAAKDLRAAANAQAMPAHDDVAGSLAVCISAIQPAMQPRSPPRKGAPTQPVRRPVDGVHLPVGLRWPSLDVPRSLDHGPALWISPDEAITDTFFGAGLASFHPPVSGWYDFRIESKSVPVLFAIGPRVLFEQPRAAATPAAGPVWLDAKLQYPALFAAAVDDASHQARVSVSFRASTTAQPVLAGDQTIFLDAVPGSWFTGTQLHAPGGALGLREPRGETVVSSGLSVVVNDIPGLCQSTAPGGCEFHIDAAVTPKVSSVEIFDGESQDHWRPALAEGMPPSNGLRIVVTGEGLRNAHAAVSQGHTPARAWYRHDAGAIAGLPFDPPSVYARSRDGDRDVLLCRGGLPAGDDRTFECNINFPVCEERSVPSSAASTGTREIGVHLSGGGWAAMGDALRTLPWPLPCVGSNNMGADAATYGLERRRRTTLLSDTCDGAVVRCWSEVLTTDFGGSANASDVAVAEGSTLIVDADMDCQYLIVEGVLRWDTELDGLTLRAAGIIVLLNGAFEIGTQADPMLLQATVAIKSLNETITVSTDDAAEYQNDFDSVFDDASLAADPFEEFKLSMGMRPIVAFSLDGVSKPTITIAGRPLVRTWTLMAQTAEAGESTLWLEHDPVALGWRVGDTVSIADTNKGDGLSLIYTIAAFRNTTSDGAPALAAGGLVLTEPLTYRALGNLRAQSSLGGPTVALSAEVSLMSRSVTVTGEAFDHDSATGAIGFHLMVAYQGVLRVSYARFDTCGQQRITGRYCVHMHVLGKCPDCLVQGNAIEVATRLALPAA